MTETVRGVTLPEERAVAAAVPATTERERPSWWRVRPVDRRGLLLWLVAYAVMTAVAIGVGLLVVHELGGVRSFDERVAHWFGRHRTDTWNSITWAGSMIADTYVKVPATLILCGFFLWRWRRWTEPALLLGALALEVGVFVTSSIVVDRARPSIHQLDPVPPTGAFPSGHSAAAVAFYGAIAIVVCWHTRRHLARAVAIAAAVVMPIVVGTSRMYRGMHSFTDVVVGLVIGILSLWVTWLVVRDGPAAREAHGEALGEAHG
ncbi:MAG TPA: phosphatase PAP2 family protein [Acidimicrobiia bacterium]|nr:phosphatase PAP2 family protein [Acidimicrobiia bacterium]